ncbi:DUF485 domain-containing protein [Metapseudomonas lalkuanensis]|uniref:DUF485 domain-containing protein n=1 Tax=Metapseudomonas lalkuanensis TaxID=2604832 RepID=A0A5J6QQR0_9GAMM|nr:DUF485 domain-containing protein [Pseudomonas lalkuanensis]QEY63019.1 DUF485 domain-containing protein [Pseudomonas lalkuanensis]
MEPNALAGIRTNPLFVALVRRRRRFVACLTAATLLPYFAFIYVAGFMPEVLAARFSAASIVTIGWPISVVLIVGAWLLTGLYIRRANGEFDELTAKILAGEQ